MMSHVVLRTVLRVAMAGVLGGCIGESGLPTPPLASDDALWRVVATPRAITVAVAGVQLLTATPVTITGATTQAGTPTYTSNDPATVRVDANGLITGVSPAVAAKQVTATFTANGVTRSSTVFVTVVATPSTLGSLSAQVAPPDSAIVGAGTVKTLRATARTPAGATISGVTFSFTSLDTTIARVTENTGALTGIAPGTVKVAVVTTAFGVTKGDTVAIRITRPVVATIQYTRQTNPPVSLPSVTVAKNATVTWSNTSGANFDVTFTDPTNVSGGNIPTFASGSRSRKFPVAGTYTWQSTTAGVGGTVVVE